MTNARLTIGLSVSFAVQLLVASHAIAADQMILGKSFYVVDKGPSSGKVAVTAKELTSPNTIVGDPVADGGSIRVILAWGPNPFPTIQDQTFALPATGWSPLGTIGFKYTNPAAGDDAAAYKVIVKNLPSGAFLIKALLRRTVMDGELQIYPAANPQFGGIVLTLGSGDNYCVGFAGSAGGKVAFHQANNSDYTRITGPTAEACPYP